MSGNLSGRGLADLQGVLHFLQEQRQVVRVTTPVNLEHELAGVASKFDGGKPVLFSAVQKREFPVLAGLYWNREVLARIFDVPVEKLPFYFADMVSQWQQTPVPPVVVESGAAQEVVATTGSLLSELPIPTSGTQEGGPYITAAVVICNDPDTGMRNASIMRFMVTGPDRLTCQMDIGRHLRDYYERAERRGEPLPVTINCGVGPAVHIAAVVPANAAPMDTDELGIASALLGEPLKLVRAKTVPVEAVADSQFVIEGEILPQVREPEGPAAEVTGYYAQKADRWVCRVKAITRRRNPVWHHIMPGREVHNAVGLMAEASIFRTVQRLVPALKGVVLTYGGCGFYHAVIQLNKQVEGIQRNAIMATFAAFPPLKMVTAVDDDVNIYDPRDVEWALATRMWPDRDLIVIPAALGHELNPTTDGGLGAKLGIDATAPVPRPDRFQRMQFQPVSLAEYQFEE